MPEIQTRAAELKSKPLVAEEAAQASEEPIEEEKIKGRQAAKKEEISEQVNDSEEELGEENEELQGANEEDVEVDNELESSDQVDDLEEDAAASEELDEAEETANAEDEDNKKTSLEANSTELDKRKAKPDQDSEDEEAEDSSEEEAEDSSEEEAGDNPEEEVDEQEEDPPQEAEEQEAEEQEAEEEEKQPPTREATVPKNQAALAAQKTRLEGSKRKVEENKASSSRLKPRQELHLEVEFQLGKLSLAVSELYKLHAGTCFKLDRSLPGPVDVLVDGQIVARGELVQIGKRLGVRLIEVNF